MHFFKKINQYLLENHPLLWHSKFVQLMVAGVIFWALSFTAGYLMIDLNALKWQYINIYYFNSSFISYHILFCLIILCTWAIFFYKNNAIKSFYPLQKFYLLRLFALLLIAFSFLVAAKFPFQAGCYAKVKIILPQKSFEDDFRAIKLGEALAIPSNEEAQYKFTNRTDYQSLNLTYIKFDNNNGKWSEQSEYYYYPEYLNAKYIEANLLYRSFVNQDDSLITQIDGEKYLFFTTVDKFTGADSCSSITLVKDFVKLNLNDLHLISLRNYDGLEMSNYWNNGPKLNFSTNINSKFNGWIDGNHKDSIVFALQKLNRLLEKYDIASNIPPHSVANYLEAKNYYNLTGIRRNYKANDDEFKRIHPAEYQLLLKMEKKKELAVADRDLFIAAMENQDRYFYNSNEVAQLQINYQYANEGIKFSEIIWFLFIGFFLAWLFLFFEFANIISLLISIPIGGGLMIIVGIALVYINLYVVPISRDWETVNSHFAEKISSTIIFMVISLILLFTVIGVYKKRFNKKILNILINLSYLIAPFYIGTLATFINIMTAETVYGKCAHSSYKYYLSTIIQPHFILLFAMIGVLAIFPLIIKWRAKEE